MSCFLQIFNLVPLEHHSCLRRIYVKTCLNLAQEFVLSCARFARADLPTVLQRHLAILRIIERMHLTTLRVLPSSAARGLKGKIQPAIPGQRTAIDCVYHDVESCRNTDAGERR